MKPKIYVASNNATLLNLNPREIEIVVLDTKMNINIIEPSDKTPILVNGVVDMGESYFTQYPWVIRDVRESLISMAAKLQALNINHPNSFLITSVGIILLPLYLKDNVKYILKKNLEARSTCKLITDKNTLIDFVNFRSNTLNEKVNKDYIKSVVLNNSNSDDATITVNNDSHVIEEYYIDHVLNNSLGEVRDRNEITKAIDYFVYDDNSMFVQEYINIISEYRIVWFNTGDYNDWVILKRHSHDLSKVDQPFDMETTLITSKKDRDEIFNYLCSDNIKFKDKIELLGTTLKTFRLSIDVYKDTDNNFGILEYQTELYSHEVPNITELSTKAMIYTINNLTPSF